MSKKLYDTLWVNKSASQEEIKKAYRKQAMKYHPDKNKGDKTAEKKFKELNEAYQILWDPEKRKQYDSFGSTGWSPFSGASWGNPFSGASWGFEDIFSQFTGAWWSHNVEFDFGDLFGWAWRQRTWRRTQRQEVPKKPQSLDFEKNYEVPVFDMILGCKIEVTGVYGQKAKLKIPAGTKSGAKFRVKEFGKSEGNKKWNLIVKVEAKMPKNISDVDKQMLERIRENVGY